MGHFSKPEFSDTKRRGSAIWKREFSGFPFEADAFYAKHRPWAPCHPGFDTIYASYLVFSISYES